MPSGITRKIVGFHQDEQLDWVAELECAINNTCVTNRLGSPAPGSSHPKAAPPTWVTCYSARFARKKPRHANSLLHRSGDAPASRPTASSDPTLRAFYAGCILTFALFAVPRLGFLLVRPYFPVAPLFRSVIQPSTRFSSKSSGNAPAFRISS